MKKFKTESKRLLDLMINSIYTNQEIFLRELISNASDACDKLYLASLTDKKVKLVRSNFAIMLAYDKDSRTVTVSDNGIGMSKDDLDKNLGTIAHSGSLEFKEENAADPVDIIGQFGVGFYSGFMVAHKVKVVSRAFGSDEAWAWESDGIDGYSISEAARENHGTDVILTLKNDTDEESYSKFLSEYELKHLVKKYSNYVRYPVKMEVSKSRALPKPDDAPDDYKTQYEDYTETDTLNSMTPIWKRKKPDVTEEEYNEFYKSDFHDYAAPVATFSLNAEGAISYDALMFIPSHAPFDLYSKDYQKGLALYSSNVMIMEKCPDLLSDHFNFVRGVVDSADLNLNISRETLQQNSQLRAIAKRIEKKIVSELTSMRDNDRETYEGVFECFGRGLKYGIYTSYGSLKDPLAELLLYYSAKQKKMITLREYLEAAKNNVEKNTDASSASQTKDDPANSATNDAADDVTTAPDSVADDAETKSAEDSNTGITIYYAAGSNEEMLAKMPMVRSVLAKGHDVLLCTQDVDDFCMSVMQDFDGAVLKNVAGGDLGLETEEEKEQFANIAKDNEQLLEAMKEALGDTISKVVLSSRLADIPAGISAEGPISLEMEKVLNAGPEGKDMRASRVLELNPEHAVFTKLTEAQDQGDLEKVRLFTNILYNQALLVEGLPIDDPVAFAESIGELMS
ncbi:MAG: molecular chaperone HtpG [Coriobacteriales bacterium]|jgi:molecular chaperone HtpG|nr:molecular chaperone HtpG [Coriobacteriales bacterium]